MADRLVDAWDESHASKVSEALMFCFDDTSTEMSCFVVDLVWFCFVSPSQWVVFHSRERVSIFVSEVASLVWEQMS